MRITDLERNVMHKDYFNMDFNVGDVLIAIYTVILSFGMCFLTISFIFSKFDLTDAYWLPSIFVCTILFFLPVRKIFFGYMK